MCHDRPYRRSKEKDASVKLFDSELKVMDVLWREGDLPAKAIARTLT